MQKKFLLCIFLNSLFPTPQNMGQIGLEVGLPWWLRFWERICLPCRRSRFDPWVGKIPWRGERLPIPEFLPGEFYGQRSLAGYSPWGRNELDTAEWISKHAVGGVGGLRMRSLNALYPRGKKVLGMWESLFCACPSLLENMLGLFPLGDLCPSKFTVRKTRPLCLLGIHSFLPFRSRLKCHFLRDSLDLCVWSHLWSSQAVPSTLPLHNTYHSLQWSGSILSCHPHPLSCKLQGALSGSVLSRAKPCTKQAPNKYFWVSEWK